MEVFTMKFMSYMLVLSMLFGLAQNAFAGNAESLNTKNTESIEQNLNQNLNNDTGVSEVQSEAINPEIVWFSYPFQDHIITNRIITHRKITQWSYYKGGFFVLEICRGSRYIRLMADEELQDLKNYYFQVFKNKHPILVDNCIIALGGFLSTALTYGIFKLNSHLGNKEDLAKISKAGLMSTIVLMLINNAHQYYPEVLFKFMRTQAEKSSAEKGAKDSQIEEATTTQESTNAEEKQSAIGEA
jgi:hypothetical protein